ncbi:FAA hydrolase family protein [Mangrovimicrobium sediminis]|uniref:FAA hydrolase family protein n=1 Tax=Mangrovimicrobium sediminis TaxID=2562682 RepID=A0A4Z0M0U6_9GAMM|nr:fumarylacetoacetate hydrolase family protein [Haliea sp. SAOS-164]TGD72998.1 FAA hydrolase family protein [Haliea sp. SAOS-164]
MHSVSVDGRKVTPSKIVCVGRNYVAHIAELGNEVPDAMVVFGKPNSAIGDTLYASLGGEPLHYEGEIALLIENGAAVAAGFGLDLTKRGLQSKLKDKGLPWERAKAFDGAALFSPFAAIDDAEELAVELDVDGAARQRGDVSLMMYSPATILEELAGFITLEDGDIVMTGTPAGVGAVNPGETFTGRVLQRGKLLTQASWVADAGS